MKIYIRLFIALVATVLSCSPNQTPPENLSGAQLVINSQQKVILYGEGIQVQSRLILTPHMKTAIKENSGKSILMPDGENLLISADADTWEIYNVNLEKTTTRLRASTFRFPIAAVLVDNILKTVDDSGNLRSWNTQSQSLVDSPSLTLEDKTRLVFSLAAFSIDGSRLMAADNLSQWIWDTAQPEAPLQTITTIHSARVQAAIWGKDKKLFMGDAEGRLSLTTTDQPCTIINSFESGIFSFAFSSTKNKLALRTQKNVYVLDATQSEGNFIVSSPVDGTMTGGLAFSDENTLFVVEKERLNQIQWKDKIATKFIYTDDSLQLLISLAFSPTENKLAGGSVTGKLFLWDLKEVTSFLTLVSDDTQDILTTVFSPNGKSLLGGSVNWSVFDTSKSVPNKTAEFRADMNIFSYTSAAVFKDNKQVFLGTGNGKILSTSIDTPANTTLFYDTLLGAPIYSLKFSNDFSKLIAMKYNGDILVWNAPFTANKQPTIMIDGDENFLGGARRTVLSADGNQLVASYYSSGCGGPRGLAHEKLNVCIDVSSAKQFTPSPGPLFVHSSLTVWDLRFSKPLSRQLPIDNGVLINTVVFLPNNHEIITGLANGDIILWDISTPIALKRKIFSRDGDIIFSMAISSDGSTLAVGSLNLGVALYDLRSLAPITQQLAF